MDEVQRKLKALSDPGRLRIMALIKSVEEVCVCKLEKVLDLPQPTVSRHLNKLKEAGWLNERRDGRWVHYRLADDLGDNWKMMLLQVLRQVDGDHILESAKTRLQELLKSDLTCQ